MVMEMVADSGLLRALDLVEVNPILDDRNTTAILGVELAAFGARSEDHLTSPGNGRALSGVMTALNFPDVPVVGEPGRCRPGD